MGDMKGKVALVTGASRGIGAETACLLARRGADIIINYRDKAARAEEVALAIRAEGRQALTLRADITRQGDVQALFEQIRHHFGRLDLLILNASGGMEKDRPADYATQLNVTAQERLVDQALPLMPAGGRILYITSHLAHFYGRKPVPDAYLAVAASKHTGEQALRKRLCLLAERAVDLIVVSGDLIEGTITPKLMERMQPGLIEMRRQQAGSLPSIADFATAIVAAAVDPDLESGATLYIGSTD